MTKIMEDKKGANKSMLRKSSLKTTNPEKRRSKLIKTYNTERQMIKHNSHIVN